MFDNYYVYKKEVDWSVLNQGLSIPLDIQVIFQNNIKKFISRGESKDIFLVLDGVSYKAKLVNQKFGCNFSNTYRYLCEQRSVLDERERRYFKIPEDKKEFLSVYTTEYADTYLVECITQDETTVARSFLIHEEEQNYEVSINYPETDPSSSIESIQKLAKIRKLNRAIGDSLKTLYENRCQICGEDFGRRFNVHIVESHHIKPFVISMNNDAANQIIICPNHHRVIHKAEPVFDRNRQVFVYSNGFEEKLTLNKHLHPVK